MVDESKRITMELRERAKVEVDEKQVNIRFSRKEKKKIFELLNWQGELAKSGNEASTREGKVYSRAKVLSTC